MIVPLWIMKSIARNQAISFANYPQNANVKQVSYEGRTDSNGTAKAYYEVRGVLILLSGHNVVEHRNP